MQAAFVLALMIVGVGILKDFTPLRLRGVLAVFMILWALKL